MQCLSSTLVRTESRPVYDFSFEESEDLHAATQDAQLALEEAEFQRNAVNLIERYGRIDEWTASHGNVYSISALACMQQLVERGLVTARTADFLHYSRVGNADGVRLQAFRCMVELDLLRLPQLARYMLYSLQTEASPYMRTRLWRVFCEALGRLALGKSSASSLSLQAQRQQQDALLIEADAGSDARVRELKRTQTVAGALAAVRDELAANETVKEGLKGILT